MACIKEESEDINIEETFSVKQEETEEQTNIRIEEVYSLKIEVTETQTNRAIIEEESEDTPIEEALAVKDGEQTDCPLCLRGYHQLSQHLKMTHKVINIQERKLLLAISSGRVDVRKGTCPMPACSKYTTRIDRHLKGHPGLTRKAQRETIQMLKKKKIIHELAKLRASNPAVPMASTLDQEDAPLPQGEEGTCDNPRCQQLRHQVANLKRQVETLKSALRDMTRRYRLLKRSRSIPSTQVTSKLLTALRSPEEEEEEEEEEVEEGELHAERSGEQASHGPPDQPPTTKESNVVFKKAKEGHLIPKAVLKECLSCAKRMIPKILTRLRKSGDKKDQWSFYGHLTAYLACFYGHRGAVFQNMTIKEVEEAQQTAREGSYVINISAHETNQAFGAAQLAMDAEEYGWLEEYLSMRSTLVGGKGAHYFFFTSKPNFCKNLNQYFQEAWAGMGLPGRPTFTDVRTSIATHAKNTHSPGNWCKMAKFMCYETSAADRFYSLNLNGKQSAEHRHLFESAVEDEESNLVQKVPPPPDQRGAKKPCKRKAACPPPLPPHGRKKARS